MPRERWNRCPGLNTNLEAVAKHTLAGSSSARRQTSATIPRLPGKVAEVRSCGGESSLWDLIARHTGVEMHPDTWLDSRAKRQRILDQTHDLAWKLEVGGWETKRNDPVPIWVVGLCSGEIEEVVPWRNTNFLPAVAAMNRSGQLKSLGYYLDQGNRVRYQVMTNGDRCRVEDLRERLKDLHRRVSRLAADPALKSWGIEVVCRVTEITAKRQAGVITYHPHANVFVKFKRFLGADWEKYLALARAYMGDHWVKDCKELKDPAEAIKYPVKPTELDELTSDELVSLARAMFGLKIFQPMGGFSDLRRRLDKDRLKPVKRLGSDGVWRWATVKRVSFKPRTLKDVDRECDQDNEVDQDKPEHSHGGAMPRDLLLTITAPQPRFRPKMEPCLIVFNLVGNASEILDKQGLGDLAVRARAQWSSAVKDLSVSQAAQPPALSSTPTRQLSGANPGRTYTVTKEPSNYRKKWQTHVGHYRLIRMTEQLFPEFAKRERERQIAARAEAEKLKAWRRSAVSSGEKSEKKA